MPTGQETRVVDPSTGGAKGSKLARFDLIPQDALWELAEHYGRGARKYEDRNWERGYAWSLSIAALMRHLSAFIQGDDYDLDPSLYEDGEVPTEDEQKALHITAVLWHAVALTSFYLRGIGTDDRPKPAVSEPVGGEYVIGQWEHTNLGSNSATRRNVETGAKEVWVSYGTGGGRWESVEG